MADEEEESVEGEDIAQPNFPDPVTATDEEVLAFGWQFFYSYMDKVAKETEEFRLNLEIIANNTGERVPEKHLRSLTLRAGLLLVLTRFVKLAEKGEENADSN